MDQNLRSTLVSLSKYETVISHEMLYCEFVMNISLIIEILGKKGFILFSRNTAVICFDKFPNIRLKIKRDKSYIKDDLNFSELDMEVIGQGVNELKSWFKMFYSDFNCNKLKIFLITILYLIFINPSSFNLSSVMLINDKLIDITGLFVGMVFVFIGFFYGDKERTIDVYKKGIGDKEFKIDKYIIELAIGVIVLMMVSSLIGNMQRTDLPHWIYNIELSSYFINGKMKFMLCFLVTWISIVILIICFDSLVNYYLRSMRNKYLIDAVNELSNERNKKK